MNKEVPHPSREINNKIYNFICTKPGHEPTSPQKIYDWCWGCGCKWLKDPNISPQTQSFLAEATILATHSRGRR